MIEQMFYHFSGRSHPPAGRSPRSKFTARHATTDGLPASKGPRWRSSRRSFARSRCGWRSPYSPCSSSRSSTRRRLPPRPASEYLIVPRLGARDARRRPARQAEIADLAGDLVSGSRSRRTPSYAATGSCPFSGLLVTDSRRVRWRRWNLGPGTWSARRCSRSSWWPSSRSSWSATSRTTEPRPTTHGGCPNPCDFVMKCREDRCGVAAASAYHFGRGRLGFGCDSGGDRRCRPRIRETSAS
jgi:hypothetical protein